MAPYYANPNPHITTWRFINFYDYLGIKRTATPKKILKAGKKKIKKTHPDRQGPYYASDVDRAIWQREHELAIKAMETLTDRWTRVAHNIAIDVEARFWRNINFPPHYRTPEQRRRDKMATDHIYSARHR